MLVAVRSLRTILGHQLARIFLADGYLVSVLCSYSYCITKVCHKRHFRFFCLSSVHVIFIGYDLNIFSLQQKWSVNNTCTHQIDTV